MKVEFEITKDDLSSFNLYHHFHSPTTRGQYLRAWFIFPIVWLVICIVIWYQASRDSGDDFQAFLNLLPLFSGVPLYLIYYPWAYRRSVNKLIAGMVSEGQNRGLICRHCVTISPECITEASEFVSNTTAWCVVERVVQNDNYAFIYINSIAAIIVPRRAFDSSEKFEDFVNLAIDYHEKARR